MRTKRFRSLPVLSLVIEVTQRWGKKKYPNIVNTAASYEGGPEDVLCI